MFLSAERILPTPPLRTIICFDTAETGVLYIGIVELAVYISARILMMDSNPGWLEPKDPSIVSNTRFAV